MLLYFLYGYIEWQVVKVPKVTRVWLTWQFYIMPYASNSIYFKHQHLHSFNSHLPAVQLCLTRMRPLSRAGRYGLWCLYRLALHGFSLQLLQLLAMTLNKILTLASTWNLVRMAQKRPWHSQVKRVISLATRHGMALIFLGIHLQANMYSSTVTGSHIVTNPPDKSHLRQIHLLTSTACAKRERKNLCSQ